MGRLSYTSRINGDLALTEYLFGTELGVDNLVARESAVGSGSTHPGASAANSSACAASTASVQAAAARQRVSRNGRIVNNPAP